MLLYDPDDIARAIQRTIPADEELHPVFSTTRTLTPSQRRLFNILADGEPHTIDALQRRMNRPYCSPSTIPTAIARLRVGLAGELRVMFTVDGYRLVAGNSREER